jgi:hypothetical protein
MIVSSQDRMGSRCLACDRDFVESPQAAALPCPSCGTVVRPLDQVQKPCLLINPPEDFHEALLREQHLDQIFAICRSVEESLRDVAGSA